MFLAVIIYASATDSGARMKSAVKRLAHAFNKTAMAGKYVVLGIAVAQPVRKHLE